jgi:hypothetical protein
MTELRAPHATFLEWIERRVITDARGDDAFEMDPVAPRDRLWLGRLASETAAKEAALSERFMRLDPCAIGYTVRPYGMPAWKWHVTLRARLWLKNPAVSKTAWRKSAQLDVRLPVEIPSSDRRSYNFGRAEIAAALAGAGAPKEHAARITVDIDSDDLGPLATVTVVNESVEKRGVDVLFYEVELETEFGALEPFRLDDLPDSFRYDRRVPAYGVNAGVSYSDGILKTTDFVDAERSRATYWDKTLGDAPDLRFSTLAKDPLPQLDALATTLEAWTEAHWSDGILEQRSVSEHWSASMMHQARSEAARARAEAGEIRRGISILRNKPAALKSFVLMNEAFQHSGLRKGYDSWRPFQIGFTLLAIPGLLDPADPARERVDTLWFATGGGKTETYLALVVILCLHDRLTGKTHGISAWSRFPLRMLSLQQTQRLADVLAGAELARRRASIGGEPFSLGYYVGPGTPNRIALDERRIDPASDYRDPSMPIKFQLLSYCPFCFNKSIRMDFDELTWTLRHLCTNDSCPWLSEALPLSIVDDEVYRFLPAVVVGTLDKAAMIGLSASVRGFFAAPLGFCGGDGHGFTYAKRSTTPNGCLVPGCQHPAAPMPQGPARFAPGLRVQDELHLLADSLGAIDAHYETLLDALVVGAGGQIPKIVGSSATLAGFEAQVRSLYVRPGRAFPMPGPERSQSFWSQDSKQLARRYTALAPRGQTQEFATERIAESLHKAIRKLMTAPEATCAEIGIELSMVPELISLYGTHVFYGSKLSDVEATARSLESQPPDPPNPTNVERLTGYSDLTDVRNILERLDNPEQNFDDRIHAICASSMMSHGVDIDRFNVMTIIGVPFKTSEFIQTSARIGRRYPGVVFVLHRMVFERDAKVYRAFKTFVEHGDRFVEAVAITRKSRNVLAKTMPGAFMANILAVREPQRLAQGKKPLSTATEFRQMKNDAGTFRDDEIAAIKLALQINDEAEPAMSKDVANFVDDALHALERAPDRSYPASALPSRPLLSLRDVERSVPIRESLTRNN